jgi:fructokinase
MTRELPLYGAIETGGTKCVCAIADATGRIHAEARLPTLDPRATLAGMLQFLHEGHAIGRLAAIGVACFGPINLDPKQPGYGCIARTPKSGWSHVDMVGPFAREFNCPIGFDTDVNAAAVAEQRWGAAAGVPNLVYLTIGTGIGGGVLVNGSPLHGLMHPEIGHIHPRRHALDAGFAGVCPFHGDCLEGLASGPAIVARTGSQLGDLDAAHPQWELEADYLGQLCAQLVLTLSPQRIVMGGGVMDHERLFPLIRQRTLHWLRGYVGRSEILDHAEQYLVPAALGAQAGVKGALLLAMAAASAASA